jgi:DNA modification methylase
VTAIVIQGNAMALPLPDECVDLAVTSPPYFGLRSYTDDGEHISGQVGGEATPGEFIAALIAATAEMARVLKPSGSIFLNLGDKYAGSNGQSDGGGKSTLAGAANARPRGAQQMALTGGYIPKTDIRAKSLMLLPERYRIAAVDRLGLIARAVIVWDKPNGLPESVTDRVRRSHEDWVHLTKMPRYFAAIDEIREPHLHPSYARHLHNNMGRDGAGPKNSYTINSPPNILGKLPDSVWRIPTAPLTLPAELGVDHFAAFPPEWPKRIIQGWSPSGVCVQCGEGRRPVCQRDPIDPHYLASNSRQDQHERLSIRGVSNSSILRTGLQSGQFPATRITSYTCACPELTAATRPAIVLDPFGGTGTTAMVAHALGRVGISVDLSHDYCRVAQWRTHDRAQMAKVRDEVFHKPAPQSEGQDSLFTFAAVAQGGKQ